MAVALQGKLFTHYDNFSHWAMVVKAIMRTNRFPNFTDKVIEFQEYPVGSALYIYYFTKLTHKAEYVQMLAQVYMILVSIMPMFAVGKKNKAAAVIIVLFANYMLVYNIKPTDMLVDTLLPLVSMSGLLYTIMYCRKVK